MPARRERDVARDDDDRDAAQPDGGADGVLQHVGQLRGIGDQLAVVAALAEQRSADASPGSSRRRSPADGICAAMASTGVRLRCASNRPLMRCRLPGPQDPAQTASSPVICASPDGREGRDLLVAHMDPFDDVPAGEAPR